jgi:hypothetical protein
MLRSRENDNRKHRSADALAVRFAYRSAIDSATG